jgi:hypothetical protein
LFFMEKLQLQLLQGVSHLCVPFLFSFCWRAAAVVTVCFSNMWPLTWLFFNCFF